MKNRWTVGIRRGIDALLAEPMTKYVMIITFIISLLLVTQAFVDGTERNGRFLSLADKQLAMNFVEWFGVLYGFLLPTILVRVWEQFDEIDNVLDREADAVKSLLGDLMLLDVQYEAFRKQVLYCLFKYSKYIIRFIDGKVSSTREKKAGEKLLKEIRGLYISIFSKGSGEPQESDVLKDELLTQLNNIIDYRGDRISLSTQRLFESLNFIAVVTSILWLVPFYFLYFQNPQTGEELHLGIFGWLLVIFVTFLIIIILSIIEDLDKPFDGFWTVNITSWIDLVADIKSEYKSNKPQPTDNVPQEAPPHPQGGGRPSIPAALPQTAVFEAGPVPAASNISQPIVDANFRETIPPPDQSNHVPSAPAAQVDLIVTNGQDKPVVPQLNAEQPDNNTQEAQPPKQSDSDLPALSPAAS